MTRMFFERLLRSVLVWRISFQFGSSAAENWVSGFPCMAVSSACIASGAPTTTAMRLINRLVTDTILVRTPDAKDGRRDYLTIDPAIERPLISYLNELAKVE